MEDSLIVRDRGRPGYSLCEVIKMDLDLNDISKDMVYDKMQWCCLIYEVGKVS